MIVYRFVAFDLVKIQTAMLETPLDVDIRKAGR